MKSFLVKNADGVSLTEFSVLAVLLLIFLGGAADLGAVFYAAQKVQNATREGARIAASFDGLIDNQPEVIAAVASRLTSMPFVKSISDPTVIQSTNTTNSPDLAACDRTVSVTAGVTVETQILRVIGFSEVFVEKRTTMRVHDQSLCT